MRPRKKKKITCSRRGINAFPAIFGPRAEDHPLPQRCPIPLSLSLSNTTSRALALSPPHRRSWVVPWCAGTPSPPLVTPPAASGPTPAGTLLSQPARKIKQSILRVCVASESLPLGMKRDILRWKDLRFFIFFYHSLCYFMISIR